MALVLGFLAAMFAFIPGVRSETPVDKLSRGLGNIVTSPLEIPAAYITAPAGRDPGAHLFAGIFYGTGRMAGRIVEGAYETATFLSPPYHPPADQPTPLLTLRQADGDRTR